MHHHRNRLKWKIRNNYVFFIIIAIICAIVASVFAFKVYNLERYTSMEALLDKSRREMHWGTGITDRDVEKLKKAYPRFNWEGTWDRDRWQGGQKQVKKDLGEIRAKKDWQAEKKKRLLQLERKRK